MFHHFQNNILESIMDASRKVAIGISIAAIVIALASHGEHIANTMTTVSAYNSPTVNIMDAPVSQMDLFKVSGTWHSDEVLTVTAHYGETTHRVLTHAQNGRFQVLMRASAWAAPGEHAQVTVSDGKTTVASYVTMADPMSRSPQPDAATTSPFPVSPSSATPKSSSTVYRFNCITQ